MFNADKNKHTLFLERNGVKAELDFHPVSGMMTWRQLPEYMQFLTVKGTNIWREIDRKLLLIGGANSEIRKWLHEIDINAEITNIDFYSEPNPSVSEHHIKEDFYDWKIHLNYYDQAWALWSLPAYSFSKTELEIFFIKAAISLAPGGILRVFPVNRGPGDMGSYNKKYTNEKRRLDSINVFNFLAKLGYSIETIFPKDMDNIVELLKNSRKQFHILIHKFLNEISNRQDVHKPNRIEEELLNYQNKEPDKAPFAVNVTAPSNVAIKHAANMTLIEYLNSINLSASNI